MTDGPGPATRTSRGAATAQRLREAARRTFAEVGFAAARVEDITATAGVSHGTFYTYYGNKADILDALVDNTAAELRTVTEEPWVGPDVRRTVGQVIERFVEVFSAEADVIRTWFEAAAYEQHFRHRLRDVRADYVERVADHLGPALQHTAHDASVAAGALVAMVEGYATERFARAPHDQREQAVRTLTELWFGGIQRLASDAEVDAGS